MRLTFEILRAEAKKRGKTPVSLIIEQDARDGGNYSLTNNDTGVETTGIRTLAELWSEIYEIPIRRIDCSLSVG